MITIHSQLGGVNGVAVDPSDNILVLDSDDNHRIQVFTPYGCYLRQFGKKGSGPGELNGPTAICIDSNIVCVGELYNKYSQC